MSLWHYPARLPCSEFCVWNFYVCFYAGHLNCRIHGLASSLRVVVNVNVTLLANVRAVEAWAKNVRCWMAWQQEWAVYILSDTYHSFWTCAFDVYGYCMKEHDLVTCICPPAWLAKATLPWVWSSGSDIGCWLTTTLPWLTKTRHANFDFALAELSGSCGTARQQDLLSFLFVCAF